MARYTIRLARVESLREPITWCIIHNAWPVPARPLLQLPVCTRRARAPRFSRTPATGGEVRGPKGKKGGEGRLDNGSSRETNSISDARVPTDLSRAKTSGQTSVDVSNVPPSPSLSLSFSLSSRGLDWFSSMGLWRGERGTIKRRFLDCREWGKVFVEYIVDGECRG